MSRSGSNKPGTFQKGNTVSVGNPGPVRGRPITSVIIQKLNEVNKDTNREYIWDLVDELFRQAITHDEKIVTGKGKSKKTHILRVKGDLRALDTIVERADGKAVQSHSVEPGSGKITFIFESGDEKL